MRTTAFETYWRVSLEVPKVKMAYNIQSSVSAVDILYLIVVHIDHIEKNGNIKKAMSSRQ